MEIEPIEPAIKSQWQKFQRRSQRSLRYTVHTIHLVQSILPASFFCLAKTFLRHDERCIKHIDYDLMNSGNVTRGAHQTSEETIIIRWQSRFVM